KGGGVLAMFEHYYGAEKFRKGVQLYLQRFAWGTATSADFLRALADATGDPGAEAAFRSFLDQPGVPIVPMNLSCDAHATASLRQTRYIQRPPIAEPTVRYPGPFNLHASRDAMGDQLWSIPLCLAYGDGADRHEACDLIAKHTARVELGARCPAWVLPN